ncbi:uncharacterized protein LOC118427460 [Branchiostoma floridae]|uniref:Uncharacterized protein LOC118427460 n=1 Tax=Branchiostoma floridae TaxID=7739 RepID=A0A9J7M2K1_BRAFL|nr:uncharacterized protein LOC118427460 [Branchiostoma floridae]
MGKVLSQLPLVKAKEVLETILSAALTGNRMPEERIKIVLQAKTVVSELENNRELIGKVLVYMARVGKCMEVQEELMKEKQDGTLRIRPSKAVSQIGDDDFLDIMKALVESVKNLWGADQLQATQYIENEIFTCCIHGLVWNDKVQHSLSFIAWFLDLLCARKMEEPSDSLTKNLEHMAKNLRKAVDKRHTESIATRIEGKEGKAVAACILSLPGFKGSGYTYQQRMKNILNTFKQNKWLLTFLLNQPDGPKGTVVADWIWENGPEILDKLTEEATTRLVSSVEKGSGYNILKGLVKSSGNKGIEKKRRIVQFAQCLLNQLQKYDRMSNDILAYIITKVDPIIRSMDDPSAKASLQQLYQKNFEFCPTMKSLEELKKVCSPEEWLDKKDSCLVYYINDIKSLPTCLTCLVLLMKSGSDHITELLSLPVTRETCNSFSSGPDSFSPACPAVIKKIAAVLKEIPSAEATQFLEKAKSWLVAESWSSLLCAGRPCRNKVQPSMDVLWKVIAEISPQELVNILRAAMKAVERKFNVITVTHFMRSAYVTWLLRVKDAFRLANQLVQFGRNLNGTLRVLKRKKPLTHEVKASGLLLNLPDKENPLKQSPAMQNAKKGNGASPNVTKALKTLNISNKGSGTNKDDAATRLMKELITKKSSPGADRCGIKHPATCVSANATPMELADSGNSVKKASRHFLSATSVQSTGKSANKYSYQTRSKDKSTAQSTGSCALAKTALTSSPLSTAQSTGSCALAKTALTSSPLSTAQSTGSCALAKTALTSSPLSTQAPAAGTNSSALSASAGSTGGDQKGGNTGGDQTGGNTGGDQKGGNTGGDQKGGNTGGDQKGGNTGGGQKGGNTGGDQKGGNTGGDQKGGNTGGGQKGGNTGGGQKGGNTGGDQKGGNTGGGQKGGNTGGGQKGGNTGGDQKGGSTGGDQKGGNTGGGQKGGNTGGDQKGGSTGGGQKGGNTGGGQKGGNTGGDQKGGNTGGGQKGGNTGGGQKGGNTGGDQKGGSPELTNIGSKILELTKTTGVDGAFQLIIGRMTGKVASSSPLAEDIVSKLLKLKGPINLKIGNNRLVINAQLAATSAVIPNVPPPQPAQTMPNPRSVTTVPYVDPTTPNISQSAPQHMYGPTGPNLALRPILPRAPATGSVSTYVPGAMPTVPHAGSFTMPVVPTCSVAVQPTTHSTPVTGAISSASSSSTTNIQPTMGAHGQQHHH